MSDTTSLIPKEMLDVYMRPKVFLAASYENQNMRSSLTVSQRKPENSQIKKQQKYVRA